MKSEWSPHIGGAIAAIGAAISARVEEECLLRLLLAILLGILLLLVPLPPLLLLLCQSRLF